MMIKNCKCGGLGAITKTPSESPVDWEFTGRCSSCLVQTGPCLSKASAIAEWNRCVDAPVVTAPVATTSNAIGPCKCGGVGEMITIPPSPRTGEPSYHIRCNRCDASTNYCIAGALAIGYWNKAMTRDAEPTTVSDGSSADYYELPPGATQLQDLISHRDMNAQIGEIQRAVYRYGMASHSDKLRDAKKIKFYIDAEIKRLEALREI